MIKLFATDMDGTFLRGDMTYDVNRFEKLYQKMQATGRYFVAASSNQYEQIKTFFGDYPRVIYLSENGARVRDQEQVYTLHTFEPQVVTQVLNVLTKMPDLQLFVCGEKATYALRATDPLTIAVMRNYYVKMDLVDSFADLNDRILKIALTCSPARTEAVMATLSQQLQGLADITSSGAGDIDVIQPGIHKAAGLAELGQKLGVQLSEMCAFGNGGNDIEMLREVGLGVAVKNADPAVKKAADEFTTSNEQQGVLQKIAQILDQEESMNKRK